MLSRKTLAVKLSKMHVFDQPKDHLEQYPTDSDTAATFLHNANLLDDIQDKSIVDLGAGTGILGCGALLLGAKHVTFWEIDSASIELIRKNVQSVTEKQNYAIMHRALQSVPCDTIIMNPPFGVQQDHADRAFLEAAMRSAPVIYSIHLAGSEQFLASFAEDHGYKISHEWPTQLLLANTMEHHTKKNRRSEVLLVRFHK